MTTHNRGNSDEKMDELEHIFEHEMKSDIEKRHLGKINRHLRDI